MYSSRSNVVSISALVVWLVARMYCAGLDAIHAGHADVQQGDVRPVSGGQLDRLGAVGGVRDDL
jgi:hypothetical protein